MLPPRRLGPGRKSRPASRPLGIELGSAPGASDAVTREPIFSRPGFVARAAQAFLFPNLLTSTLSGGAPPQAPFIPTPTAQVMRLPRVQQPTLFANLLATTLQGSVELQPFFYDLGAPTQPLPAIRPIPQPNVLPLAPVVAPGTPFVPVTFDRVLPRPQITVDQPPNLLASTLNQATTQNPFEPYPWPTARPVAPTRTTDTLNLLTTTLAPVVVVDPVRPYDWPVARGVRVQQPDQVASFAVLQPGAPPEQPPNRWDWQSPVQARRVQQPDLPQNNLGLPNPMPPTPVMWPQARPAPRNFEQWAFHFPLPLGIPLGAPSLIGTLPNIVELQNSGLHQYNLGTIFVGATSYSIAPGLELGWSFDTTAAILTIDTDALGVFGAFVVTASNLGGTVDSNGFTVTVQERLSDAGRKRIREIYRVTIDGRKFEFKSLAEALRFLDKAKKAAADMARQATREATERQRKSAKPVPVPTLTPPVIGISSRDLRGAASETKREIAEIYRQAIMDAEIAMLLEIDARQKDDDETMMWLM